MNTMDQVERSEKQPKIKKQGLQETGRLKIPTAKFFSRNDINTRYSIYLFLHNK